MTPLENALAFTLKWEGGYSNNPNDPGGATMRGITQKVYDAYRLRVGLPRLPVRNISDAEVQAIYEQQYWGICKCDQLPEQLATAVFDTAVNVGCSRAIKILQGCVGVTADGLIGSGTITAINEQDPTEIAMAFLTARQNFYNRLVAQKPSSKLFLKGWTNRVDALRKYIQ